MPNWPERWLKQIGGKLPSRYVAIDIETSGFSMEDPIVSLAHCQVNNGKIEHLMHVYLDWRDTPWVSQSRLQHGLQKVASDLYGYNITYDKLCQKGMEPGKVFEAYHYIFTNLMRRGYYIVGHNSYRFDEPRLANAFSKLGLGKEPFTFKERLIDTQSMEIASRNATDAYLRFSETDTLRSWCKRLINHSSKFTGMRIMENLVEKYHLVINDDRSHDADMGALAAHYLMEHFRTVVDNRHAPLHPSQWDSDDARSKTTNPVPVTGLPLKSSKPLVVTGGLKRFRGQRSS